MCGSRAFAAGENAEETEENEKVPLSPFKITHIALYSREEDVIPRSPVCAIKPRDNTAPLTRRGGDARAVAATRSGLSIIEVLVVLVVLAVLTALLVPFIFKARELARRNRCEHNLHQLGTGLCAYHDVHQSLMPAAVWSTNAMRSVALLVVKRHDLYTHANWAQMLLPYVGQEAVAREFDFNLPTAADANERARTTRLALLTCPSDTYNRPDNHHAYEPVLGSLIEYARGNYAINGGTHDYRNGPGSTTGPNGDAAHLVMNGETREFRFWGNGVAGFNQAFSFDDFTNGQSTLVALEEIRAGIHAIDGRGSWALGQITASVTWAHGVNGDAFCPNNPWCNSDDILGCGKLHDLLGTETLAAEGMPCVDYLDINQNATARSQHEGGVNVLFLDGRVRFISDSIDPGLWHVMHSRETPADVVAEEFEQRLSVANFTNEAPPPRPPNGTTASEATDALFDADSFEKPLVNSVGMTFVAIPSGEFVMGVSDEGNRPEPREACIPHHVRITRPFLLGVHEVTRGQYEAVVDSLPPAQVDQPASAAREPGEKDAREDNLPAVSMTWHEADAFCRRLSERPEEVAAGRWYRLPTEAEWEYACRSGKSEPYVWRRQRDPEDRSGEAAGMRPPLPIAPVGSYPPNEFGLYDMRGNAWEWADDWFDRDYYLRSPVDDPRGPSHGYHKVLRGSDWRFIGEWCHIDYPIMPPWMANPFVGFRVVCVLTRPVVQETASSQ